MTRLAWLLVLWVLVQLALVLFDWSFVISLDEDPKWGYAERRLYFYLAWSIAGTLATVAATAWVWGRGALPALVWSLFGNVTLLWWVAFVSVCIWRGWWANIEHAVSSTTHVEANDALRAIVLTNFVGTLVLMLTSTTNFVGAYAQVGAGAAGWSALLGDNETGGGAQRPFRMKAGRNESGRM